MSEMPALYFFPIAKQPSHLNLREEERGKRRILEKSGYTINAKTGTPSTISYLQETTRSEDKVREIPSHPGLVQCNRNIAPPIDSRF